MDLVDLSENPCEQNGDFYILIELHFFINIDSILFVVFFPSDCTFPITGFVFSFFFFTSPIVLNSLHLSHEIIQMKQEMIIVSIT